MDHICGRDADRFTREAGIGHVARMAAQEVIGDAATDGIELDALPDQPGTGQGAAHVEGQHFGGQHLQLQRHRQTVFRPARPDANEDLARQEYLARRPALQPVEVGQPLGVGIVSPGQPERLQLFFLCGRFGIFLRPAMSARLLAIVIWQF